MKTFEEWHTYYVLHVGCTEREAHELAAARVVEQENRERVHREFPPPVQRWGEWEDVA